MELLLCNCHNFFFIYITTLDDVQIQSHCPSLVPCKPFSSSASRLSATSGTISQDNFNTKFLLGKFKLVRLLAVKFHVEIIGTLLFHDGTPIFQMGLLFLEKEESGTPTFKIQVRTLVPFGCKYQ